MSPGRVVPLLARWKALTYRVVGPLRSYTQEGWVDNNNYDGVYVFHVCLDVYIVYGTGQVGLGVGSWPSNRATEGSNPKGTRLYFVILLKNVEKIHDWH